MDLYQADKMIHMTEKKMLSTHRQIGFHIYFQTWYDDVPPAHKTCIFICSLIGENRRAIQPLYNHENVVTGYYCITSFISLAIIGENPKYCHSLGFIIVVQKL